MQSRRDTIRLMLAGGAAALGSISRGSSLLAQTTPSNLDFVDPELRPFARQMQSMIAGMPPFTTATLPALRAAGKNWSRAPLPDVPWERRTVPGAKGHPDVTVYVINAKAGAKRGGIVYMHGGGYVSGAAALEIDRSQELAQTLDCAVVSVEYRLAPETRYDGSIEDNYAALRWTFQHAEELGVNTSRIAILGESAGGGHAAQLAITARDRGEFKPAFQCLVYPMLDDRTGTTRPVPKNIGTILWTPTENAFGWGAYLGRIPGGSGASGVPARARDLTGLPPAWIGVGSIDLFMQEDVEYAKRLNSSGVPTELLVVPGAFHGFDLIGASTNAAQRFRASKLEVLRRALA